MTGLEKITEQIITEAKKTADQQIAEAKKKAEELTAAAKAEGEQQAAAIQKQADKDVAQLTARAVSSAQLEGRNQLLVFKQNYIDQLIDDTRASLENAPERAYFQSLLILAKRYAKKEPASMRLNQRDLARLPADFQQQACTATGASIRISLEPADIKGGFLLIYDGIDLNCTFEALTADRMDQLRDTASEMLFSK